MSKPRFAILERLGDRTDPAGDQSTSIKAIASTLDLEEPAVEHHVEKLIASELVHRSPDGAVRITITGSELLELDISEVVIVEPSDAGSDP